MNIIYLRRNRGVRGTYWITLLQKSKCCTTRTALNNYTEQLLKERLNYKLFKEPPVELVQLKQGKLSELQRITKRYEQYILGHHTNPREKSPCPGWNSVMKLTSHSQPTLDIAQPTKTVPR